MKLERILPFARTLLRQAVQEGDTVVDATLGNGHDTLFLAELVGENGRVFGFDIQSAAIEATTTRLASAGLMEQVTLFEAGHERVGELIPRHLHGSITGAIFNLGYLPGGNKEIVTRPDTTIDSVRQLIGMLAVEGMIILVVYHGHEQGAVERDELLSFVESLDQQEVHVLRYQFVNQQNQAPFIIAIEKR